MRKMVGRREVVTEAVARDAGGVSTTTITVEIMWELPLQIMLSTWICQLSPSSLLGPVCQMAQEDLLWVGESQLL